MYIIADRLLLAWHRSQVPTNRHTQQQSSTSSSSEAYAQHNITERGTAAVPTCTYYLCVDWDSIWLLQQSMRTNA